MSYDELANYAKEHNPNVEIPPSMAIFPQKKAKAIAELVAEFQKGFRLEFNAIAFRELGVHDKLEKLLNEEIRCSQASSPQGDALATSSSSTTDTKPAVVGMSVEEWHKKMSYTESAWSQTNECGLNIAQVKHVVSQVQKLFINDGRPQHQGKSTTLLKMLEGKGKTTIVQLAAGQVNFALWGKVCDEHSLVGLNKKLLIPIGDR